MSLNKVMLIGNVGKDPEVRYLEGNAKVASFPLATTERYKDRSGEMKENTEWHNIVAWRNSADVAEKYIRKGTQIYVEGRLRTRNWTDQTGAKKYTTEIVVDSLELLGRRSDNPAAAQGSYAPAAPAQGGFQQRPAYGAPSQGSGYGSPAGFAPAAQGAPYGQAPQQAGFASASQNAAPSQGFAPQAPAQTFNDSAPIDLGGDDGSDDLPF